MPNPITGNVVVATVNLVEPEDPEKLEQRVRAFCEKRLQPFKVPAFVEITSERLYNERFKKAVKA